MATIFYTDSTEKEISPANGKDFSLTELKEIIRDGDNDIIEIVYPRFATGKLLVINEEGRIITPRLEFNDAATRIVGGVILGNVLLCKISEIK